MPYKYNPFSGELDAVDITGGGSSIPTQFDTDSGSAIPAANILDVLGGTGISTSGASNAVTIDLDTPVTVANGGTGATTLTDGGILLGSGTSAVTVTAQPTDGQLLIGSTGVDPVLSTLTAGTGITITNAAGSITIDATGSGFTWNEETGTSATMADDNGYIANNAAKVVLTTPATCAVGDTIAVVGKGAGGWTVRANGLQVIRIGSSITSAGGDVDSTNQYDCIELLCTTANSIWTARSTIGNLTLS